MKHLKTFEATFQSAEGSGQVPEVPTGRKLRPYMIDNLKPEMGGGEVMKPTKSEVLGNLNISDVRSSDTITLTKGELQQFMNDVDRGLGIWSDTSYRICIFLGIDPTDGV